MDGRFLVDKNFKKKTDIRGKKRKYPKIPEKGTKNHLLHIPDVLQVGFINGTTWKTILQHPLPWSDSGINFDGRCRIPRQKKNLVVVSPLPHSKNME
jgi:hypothetical protein